MADEKELDKIIVLDPVTDSLNALLKIIEEKNQAALVRVTSVDEASQIAMQSLPCMLFASIISPNDVPPRAAMFKKMERTIKSGQLKTLVASKLKNPQLRNLITGLGITDYIEEPVPVRTIQFKANLQLKAVANIRKQQQLKLKSEEKIVFKTSDKKKTDDPAGYSETPVKPANALSLEEDTFLFKNSSVKKLGKKLTVDLDGPDPETGEWVKKEDKGNAKTSWRWVPEEDKDNPAKTNDGWMHEGDKPVFNPETKKWQLTSEKPDLSFHKDGKKIASKVSTDEKGEVQVAADSEKALANLQKNAETAKKRQKVGKGRKDRDLNSPGSDSTEKDAGTPEKNQAAKEPQEQDKKNIAQNNSVDPEAKDDKKEAGTQQNNPEAADTKEPPVDAGKEVKAKRESKLAALRKRLVEAGAKDLPEEKPVDVLAEQFEEKKSTPAAPIIAEAKKNKLKTNPNEIKASESSDQADKNDKQEEDEPSFRRQKEKQNAEEEDEELALLRQKNGKGRRKKDKDGQDNLYATDTDDKEEESLDKKNAIESMAKLAKKPKLEIVEEEAKDETEKTKENEPSARAPSLKEKRKAIVQQIQKLMRASLPDKLTEAQEATVRKKLGLEKRPEISAKELIKKERLADIKELKDKLSKMDQEEEKPELATDEDKEKPEKVTSEDRELTDLRSREEKQRNFSAHDSDLEQENEERERAKALERENKKKEAKALEDKALYMAADKITPLSQVWEPASPYYVYLSSQVRYHGFKKLEDLLPLWIYKGDRVPELLDKSNDWRFYGSLPFQAQDTKSIPQEVRDFLLGIRDQLKKPDKKNTEEEQHKADKITNRDEAESEPTKKDKENAEDFSAEKEKEDSEESNATDFGEEAESFKKNKRKEDEESTGDFKALRDDPEQKDKTDDGALAKELEAFKKERKEARARAEAESNGADFLGSDDETESEKNAREARLEKEDEEAFEKLKELKAKEVQDALEDSDKVRNALGDDEAEKKNDESLSEDFSKQKEEKEEAESSTAGKITAELSEKSESIQNFLERRKNKEKNAAKEEAAVAKKEASQASSNPYLGIFVTLSDSLNPAKNIRKSVLNPLRAVEGELANIAIFMGEQPPSEGSTTVLYSLHASLPEGEKTSTQGLTAFPICKPENESEILAYLYIQALSPRESFAEKETAMLRQVANMLWPILKKHTQKEAA